MYVRWVESKASAVKETTAARKVIVGDMAIKNCDVGDRLVRSRRETDTASFAGLSSKQLSSPAQSFPTFP